MVYVTHLCLAQCGGILTSNLKQPLGLFTQPCDNTLIGLNICLQDLQQINRISTQLQSTIIWIGRSKYCQISGWITLLQQSSFNIHTPVSVPIYIYFPSFYCTHLVLRQKLVSRVLVLAIIFAGGQRHLVVDPILQLLHIIQILPKKIIHRINIKFINNLLMKLSYVIIKTLIEHCKQVISDINQRIGASPHLLDLDGEIQVLFADLAFVEEVIPRHLELLTFVLDLFGVVVFLVNQLLPGTDHFLHNRLVTMNFQVKFLQNIFNW